MSEKIPNAYDRPTIMLPAEARAYYADNAYDYVCSQILRPVWKDFKPSLQQKKALDSVSKYERTGIASGHGTGKGNLFAWIGIWFMDTRPTPCRVPCTAPTGAQLRSILWPYFNRWINIANTGGNFEWRKEAIWYKNAIEREGGKDNHFALWRTSDKSDNMQGNHAPHMCWLIDEAWGVTNPMVWEVIEASMTEEDNKMIFAGNYTVAEGYSHTAFSKDAALWVPENSRKLLRFNSEDCPFVDKKKIKQIEDKWGRNHDVYRTRVLGLPPLGNPDAFIKLSEIQAAINRPDIEPKGKLVLAIDSARKGADICAFFPRIGNKGLPFESLPESDEVQIYEKGLTIIRELRKKYNLLPKESHPAYIKIDTTGGYGGGAYDLFKRNTTDNIRAIAISYSAAGNDDCMNATSVMYQDFKDVLPKISLPDDPDMVAEITSRQFKYTKHNGREKLLIESKDAFKKRFHGASPNKADALIMSFSEKTVRKKVIPDFEPSEHRATLKIKWTEEDHISNFVSVYCTKQLRTGYLIMKWNAIKGSLYVIAEGEADNPHAKNILFRVNASLSLLSNGQVQDSKSFQWFGNNEFFDGSGGDMRSGFRKYGINVRENTKYNEPGAMLETIRLVSEKKIWLSSGLEFLPYQMLEWGYDNYRTEEGYLLCRSLLNVVSALYERVASVETIKPIKRYSKESGELQKRAREAVVKDRYSFEKEASTGTSSWMLD